MNNQALALVAAEMKGVALEDTAQFQYRVEIRSASSSRIYTVSQRKSNGEYCCSCPGWKRWRNCKHLDTMVPLLAQAVKPEPVRRIG